MFSLQFAGQRIVPGLAGALRVPPRPDGARARSRPAREGTSPRDPQTTTLHRVVREHLETFLARHAEAGEPMPCFVVDELRDHLSCRLNMPLRVHLCGQSVGTLVEVEEVEVWEGVRTPSVSRSPTR